MFNQDFYPTPESVVYAMLQGSEVSNKVILEPSAGKGNIVNVLNLLGAKEVLTCEINNDLATIVKEQSKFLKPDFMQVKREEVSHINMIVMNPPFTADEKHILHAWEIAPDGCEIISLCNTNTVKNRYSRIREELSTIISNYGAVIDMGDCFANSERKTDVDISLVRLTKPSATYEAEFDGFFMNEDPEESQENGIMGYNAIRDIVNRYVESVKIWDRQHEQLEQLNGLIGGVFGTLSISFSREDNPLTREEFKKEMQKKGWKWVISKMNLEKLVTSKVRERINKFVETQTQYPFTMKNIYHMIDMVIQTREQNMDLAIEEIFDSVTKHYHENRYNLEGWKTNSHYILNKRFIFPHLVEGESYGHKNPYVYPTYSGNFDKVIDLCKALCYLTGTDYDNTQDLYNFYRNDWFIRDEEGNVLANDNSEYSLQHSEDRLRRAYKLPENYTKGHEPREWGQWYEWSFFRVRAYKKGTIHFEFLDDNVWATFNQRVSKIKGFPLPEKVNTPTPKKKTQPTKKAEVLFSIKVS